MKLLTNCTMWVAYVDMFENVMGGDGNDILTGNALANILFDGPGDDTLNGGDGDDYYKLVGAGMDTVTDSTGVDTLKFVEAGESISVDLRRFLFLFVLFLVKI